MRFFSTVAALGLVAAASAQSSSDVTSVIASITSSSVPASSSAALTTEQRCLADCGDSDICCKAACVNVPCPNDLQANQTTDCAAQCPQGDGSEEDTSSYASCQQSCITSLFFPLSATAGGAASTGTVVGSSEASATSASETGIGGDSSSETSNETGASASATGGSDANSSATRTKIAGAGLIGLVIAGLAL